MDLPAGAEDALRADVRPQLDQRDDAVASNAHASTRLQPLPDGRPLDEVLEVGLDLVARGDVLLQHVEAVDLLEREEDHDREKAGDADRSPDPASRVARRKHAPAKRAGAG